MDKWLELYDWLGSEAETAKTRANRMDIPDSSSLYLGTKAETMGGVRAMMRTADPSLPLEEIDDLV